MDKLTIKIIIGKYEKVIEDCKNRIKSYETGIKEEEKRIQEFQIMINNYGDMD